ncbi:hypothetical protein [Ornithinimicrobium faecis]|uniref:Uncharacterized protein n=1 Tax=Ornithinimicrobium faecis TaxID=2934158 RepID=A0ABY4YNI1_9MICO|nr:MULTISPECIES: hypothetical protein [unclassified Ornithinimicrobium]USQ78167.1 hypothetical protein NF556_10890 [Ornithinimicrobium sp. HY1793]
MLATTRQRVAVLAAGLLIVLALGLPWTTSTEFSTGGWYVGSTCMPNFSDGTVWCSGSFYSPGLTGGSEALSGNGTVARVFLVGALVLMIIAWIRVQPRLLLVAGGALFLGILLTGLTLLGGQLATIVAAVLLLYAALSAGGAPARA